MGWERPKTELGGTGSGSFGAQGQIEAIAFDRNGNLFASGNLLKILRLILACGMARPGSRLEMDKISGCSRMVIFWGRDGQGTIYADVSGNIYKYGASTPVLVCSGSPAITLSASQTTVSGSTGNVIIQASSTSFSGTNTNFAFASDRDFNSLLSGPSADSAFSLAISSLRAGVNKIFVKMQTNDACNAVLTITDSIVITKISTMGLTDIDNPGSPITDYPNPIADQIHVLGTEYCKRIYALSF